MKKPKFTLVDYLIILGIIIAIIFAFIHISIESEEESISFDSSTINKLGEKYLSFYRDGKIIETTVSGFNASTGAEDEIHGEIEWLDEGKSANTKLLIKSNNSSILAGLYDDVPEADFYIEQISLETSGEKYPNTTEIRLKPKNISQFNDLISEMDNNTNYEITTVVSVNDIDNIKFQEMTNKLYENNKRISLKSAKTGFQEQIIITRATNEEIAIANNILGNVEGVSSEIIIRIYNSTPEDIEKIKKTNNIENIREIN